jgi:hypothetical protein
MADGNRNNMRMTGTAVFSVLLRCICAQILEIREYVNIIGK